MKRRGFTLIELMIVVAIIAIIASIALPGMLRSRMAANEANGVAALRTISTAQVQFQMSRLKIVNNVPQFGTLLELGSTVPALLDGQLGASATPVKASYLFTFTLGTNIQAPTYTVTATAQSNRSGSRNFFTDESGVIRWRPQASGNADVSDQPI